MTEKKKLSKRWGGGGNGAVKISDCDSEIFVNRLWNDSLNEHALIVQISS